MSAQPDAPLFEGRPRYDLLSLALIVSIQIEDARKAASRIADLKRRARTDVWATVHEVAERAAARAPAKKRARPGSRR